MPARGVRGRGRGAGAYAHGGGDSSVEGRGERSIDSDGSGRRSSSRALSRRGTDGSRGVDSTSGVGRSSSSDQGTDYSSRHSQPESFSSLPGAIEDNSDWCGLDYKTKSRCLHMMVPKKKICWGGKHTGRRYLGCPLQDEDGPCRFVEWIDDEWPEKVQGVLLSLWDVMGQFHDDEEEAKAELTIAVGLRNEAVEAREEALMEKEEAIREKLDAIRTKEEEVRRIKAIAQTACFTMNGRIGADAEEMRRI